jgi:hypothetical protein
MSVSWASPLGLLGAPGGSRGLLSDRIQHRAGMADGRLQQFCFQHDRLAYTPARACVPTHDSIPDFPDERCARTDSKDQHFSQFGSLILCCDDSLCGVMPAKGGTRFCPRVYRPQHLRNQFRHVSKCISIASPTQLSSRTCTVCVYDLVRQALGTGGFQLAVVILIAETQMPMKCTQTCFRVGTFLLLEP